MAVSHPTSASFLDTSFNAWRSLADCILPGECMRLPRSQVHVFAADNGKGVLVVHEGTADALVAAGVASWQMVSPSGGGKKRTDEDGHYFWRKKNYRTGVLQICRWWIPRDAALALPGVATVLRDRTGAQCARAIMCHIEREVWGEFRGEELSD